MIRFVNGHIPLGQIENDVLTAPTEEKFTIVKNFYTVGHVALPHKLLCRDLMSFYRKLEYPPFAYTLLKPGADPFRVRETAKPEFIGDLIQRALWADKYLMWFSEDRTMHRVRSNTMKKDTVNIIKGFMENGRSFT